MTNKISLKEAVKKRKLSTAKSDYDLEAINYIIKSIIEYFSIMYNCKTHKEIENITIDIKIKGDNYGKSINERYFTTK